MSKRKPDSVLLRQIIEALPRLTAEERGRLRHVLISANAHCPGDRSKVGTQVVQGAK